MDLDEYKEMTARREYIPGGSPAHELMHGMSAEAQKITSRINCGYHTQEELRELFSELTVALNSCQIYVNPCHCRYYGIDGLTVMIYNQSVK